MQSSETKLFICKETSIWKCVDADFAFVSNFRSNCVLVELKLQFQHAKATIATKMSVFVHLSVSAELHSQGGLLD